MRPHRLTIRAFGAFADEVTVDFDALADHGLFLLFGDTGAGKTTVLDALCFALYGEVPGGRRGSKGLRSDHAEPGALAEVSLEFTSGGGRFRVRRTPVQDVLGARGKVVTRNPTATLQRLDGAEWVVVGEKPEDVGAAVGDELGMSAGQFCQVVMLPQGEFAAFLRAPDKDRAALLDKLFGAELYRQVEELLTQRAKVAEGRLDAARAELSLVSTRIEENLGPRGADDAYVRVVGGVDDIDESWLVGVRSTLETRLTAATLAHEQSSVVESIAREGFEAAESLRDRQSRRRAAEAEAAALAESAATVEEARSMLTASTAAASVAPLLAHLESVALRLTVAQQQAGGVDEDTAVAHENHVRERLALLAQHAGADAIVGETTAALEAAALRMTAIDERLTAIDEETRTASAEDEQQSAVLRAAQDAGAALPGVRAACESAASLLRAGQEWAPATLRLARAQTQETAASMVANDLRERWLTLLQERLEGMAVVLAAQLKDGQPCAVCGSPEHPAPAATTHELPDEAVVLAAQSASDEAVARLQALHAETAEAAALLAALEDRLGGKPEVDALEAAAAAATAELARVEQLAGSVTELAEQLASRSEAAARRAEEGETLRAERATLAERSAQLSSQLETQLSALAEVVGSSASVAAAQADAERQLVVAQAQREAARQVAELTQRAEEALERADAEAVAAGFASADEARAALLATEVLTALTDQVREYDMRLPVVQARLAEPDLDVALEPVAEPELAEAALAVAVQRLTEAAAATVRAHAQLERHDELAEQARALLDEMQPLQAAYDEIHGLASTASGSNPRRQKLSMFVLAARLEQVVAAASVRLERMTAGRYTMVHTDVVVDARKAAGLGLRVVDQWQGRERDVASLSGGETFQASLAMALGLADVVREESGGTRIDALFVDEGFGSLDPAALDEVMDVLDGLRDGGRMVGIVSHVPELKSRITAAIEVVKGSPGRPGSQLAQASGL